MENIEKKRTIRFNVMAIILIVIFSIAISPITLQNDTFYTIKIGEYVLENGITMQEPFAWHENLEYTFPHWAYDVMIYLIYSIGGMTGIYISTTILSSILGITMYLVNVKLNKNNVLSFILTIASLYLMKNFIAARAQLFTFILFILTIYFIEKFLENKKLRYAIGLIVIPILIANFHTATFYFYFILYLPYIAEYMLYILSEAPIIINNYKLEKWKKSNLKDNEELNDKIAKLEEKTEKIIKNKEKREANPYKVNFTYRENTKYLGIIMIIALFTGFLTPLGTTPYTYLIKTMQGISMDKINEHLPLVLINNLELICVFIFLFGILIFTDTKIRLCDLFMLGGLTYLTFSTQRQMSMLILIGVIIFNRMLSSMIKKYAPTLLEKLQKYMTTIIGMITVIALVLSVAMWQYNGKVNSTYIDEKSYPVQASKWIKENLDVNNIKLYNAYNYGSYLIYENIPVFIDSRCDLYMPEFNEGVNVFNDFINIDSMNYVDMEAKMDEYGFTHYLVKNNSKVQRYLEDKENYEKIYPTEDIQDDVFFIYERRD